MPPAPRFRCVHTRDITEDSTLMIRTTSIIPQSHLHIKVSRKNYARQFLQNEVGCGYLVAISGSMWQLMEDRVKLF